MDENESFNNYLKSKPAGSIKYYYGHGSGSENDIDQFLKNRDELQTRLFHAMKSHCYIEVISINLQVIDYWLRIYFLNKNSEKKREREFGRVMDQCKELGLDKVIYDDLKTFNKIRIDSIHGYVIGKVNYTSLFDTAYSSMALMARVAIFVLENCGNLVTNVTDLFSFRGIGDMLLDVSEQIDYYKQFLNE